MPETEDILELAGLNPPVSALKECWKVGTALVKVFTLRHEGC